MNFAVTPINCKRYNFSVRRLIWSKLLTFDESAALNTSALRYWLAVRAPPTGDCKCHVFTLLPIILREIKRDWPPLASTYMHETLYVHRTCTDVQISLLDPNPKPNRKTAIAHFRRFLPIFQHLHAVYFDKLLLLRRSDCYQTWWACSK